MANIESDVRIDALDQGMAACGFSFAYAAKRKIPARASRPTISRIGARCLRVSFVVMRNFSPYWLSRESKNCFRIGHVTIPEDAG